MKKTASNYHRRRSPQTATRHVPNLPERPFGHTGERQAGAPADARLRASSRWAKVSTWFLNREPLCMFCRKPATLVHHKVVPAGDGRLFFDTSNLASVCSACHGMVHGAYSRGIDWAMLKGGE